MAERNAQTNTQMKSIFPLDAITFFGGWLQQWLGLTLGWAHYTRSLIPQVSSLQKDPQPPSSLTYQAHSSSCFRKQTWLVLWSLPLSLQTGLDPPLLCPQILYHRGTWSTFIIRLLIYGLLVKLMDETCLYINDSYMSVPHPGLPSESHTCMCLFLLTLSDWRPLPASQAQHAPHNLHHILHKYASFFMSLKLGDYFINYSAF